MDGSFESGFLLLDGLRDLLMQTLFLLRTRREYEGGINDERNEQHIHELLLQLVAMRSRRSRVYEWRH